MTGFLAAIVIAGTLVTTAGDKGDRERQHGDEWSEIEADINGGAAEREGCRATSPCDPDAPGVQQRYDEELNWRYRRSPQDNADERRRNEGNEDE